MVAIPLKSFWFVGVKAKYFHPTIPRKEDSKIEKYVLYNLFYGRSYLVLLNLSKKLKIFFFGNYIAMSIVLIK